MKIAIYQLGSCSGCIHEVLNLGEALLELINKKGVEIAYSALLGVTRESEEFDISLVEGAVLSEEDVARLRNIRRRSKILVAIGSCAVLGGVPGLRRFTPEHELRDVYDGAGLEQRSIDEVFPLDRFVEVDYYLRGCPINKYELLSLLEKILQGKWFRQGERRFRFLRERPLDIGGVALSLDGEKCIACGRCVEVCRGITSAIDYINRSIETAISTPFKVKLDESSCISCGQCTLYCPVGALRERSSVAEVQRLLKHGARLTAYVEPEVLAALEEALKLDGYAGGRLVTALKRLGFEKVVLWAPRIVLDEPSRLTIVPGSEAESLFVQLFYPDLIDYLVAPPKVENHRVVWVTPCLARKLGESFVLTTRELLRLLNTMDLSSLTETPFDDVLLERLNVRVIKAVGMREVEKTLNYIRDGKLREGVVVLYTCPGGCLYGGGQPYLKPGMDVKRERILAQVIKAAEEWRGG
ncbi:hypothetical protein DRO58_01810 [Candidatus Bathyarchaeota archaeon]|nr:MAG: hypothetical protein DRO58_01810 [Candidatus Bathyarchaeota archaeon]